MKGFPYPVFNLILYLGLLAFLWWIISGGATDSWLIGVPMVLIAAYVSVALKAKQALHIHILSLIKFIPFFLRESVLGGIDVARRAYSPRLPLKPACITYPIRLPEGAAQTFFANIISLLPGTLCAGIKDRTMHIHVLDETAHVIRELETLESRIAAIFGTDLNNCEHLQRGDQK